MALQHFQQPGPFVVPLGPFPFMLPFPFLPFLVPFLSFPFPFPPFLFPFPPFLLRFLFMLVGDPYRLVPFPGQSAEHEPISSGSYRYGEGAVLYQVSQKIRRYPPAYFRGGFRARASSSVSVPNPQGSGNQGGCQDEREGDYLRGVYELVFQSVFSLYHFLSCIALLFPLRRVGFLPVAFPVRGHGAA